MFRTICIAAVFLVAAVSASAQSAEAVAQGQKVYTAEKCGVCHAIAGVGNRRGPLDGVGSKLSADEIRQWMVDAPGMTAKTKATRKPLMRSYPGLAKDDLDSLVAYLLSLKKT